MSPRTDPTDNTTPRLAAQLHRAGADLNASMARLPSAMRRLTAAQPGYPTQPATTSRTITPRDEDRDEHSPSTQPERHEAIMSDDAMRDLAEIDTLARVAERTARRLRELTTKWGVTLVGTRVAEPTDTLWCKSCSRVNSFEPRRVGGMQCLWCDRTLRAVNVVRAERHLDALDELPLAAVQKHAQVAATGSRRVPITERDILEWAGVRMIGGRRSPSAR